MKNCIYSRLETSGNLQFGQNITYVSFYGKELNRGLGLKQLGYKNNIKGICAGLKPLNRPPQDLAQETRLSVCRNSDASVQGLGPAYKLISV